MKKFYNISMDLEMDELSKKGNTISIGLYTQDGESFYAENIAISHSKCNDWIKENILSRLVVTDKTEVKEELDKLLKGTNICFGDAQCIAMSLQCWLEQLMQKKKEEGYDQIKVWSDCYAYDWTFFVDLFGTAFDVPGCIYYVPSDLSTLLHVRGIDDDINREALHDADDETIGRLMAGDIETLEPVNHILKHNALFDAKIEMDIVKRLFKI